MELLSTCTCAAPASMRDDGGGSWGGVNGMYCTVVVELTATMQCDMQTD